MKNLFRNKKAQTDGEIAILIGIGIIILLIILALPVTGNVFGQEVKLPLIGWVGFAAFAVIALYLFFKHRA
jgi:uncharacterized membrane protein